MSSASNVSSTGSKRLNAALWITQCILVIPFSMVGAMKVFLPISRLAQNWHWVASLPFGLVRFIGIAELAGAGINLILAALAIFIAWGRWKKVPIEPRG